MKAKSKIENKLVSELLNDDLEYVSLNVLKDNADLYDLMFIQPSSSIEANKGILSAVDSGLAVLKFNKFIDLAFDKKPDLVVSPEYSCPWPSLSYAIQKNGFPCIHKLCVFGCESIRPTELRKFINQHNDIEWIIEPEILDQGDTKSLDPLCYLFYAKCAEENYRKVAIFQFKNTPMGGSEYDRDNLIFGKVRYIFRNQNGDIRLFSLLCSDALNFEIGSIDDYKLHHLVLHLQLVRDPFKSTFCAYRNIPYTSNEWGNRYEFLCINHAKETKLNTDAHLFGGSCFYTKSLQLNLSDERINQNHTKGLYFSRNDDLYSFNFYFNYVEAVYYLRSTKVSQAEANTAHPKRTGPEMLFAYAWNVQNSVWTSDFNPNDGFFDECNEFDDCTPLTSEELNALNRERLLCLSTGEIRGRNDSIDQSNWYSPRVLGMLNVGQKEAIKSATFTQYPCDISTSLRRQRILMFHILKNNILTDSTQFPRSLIDFSRNGCKILYPISNDKYHLNISTNNDSNFATAVYVGEIPIKDVHRKRDDLLAILKDSEKNRLVVWYRNADGDVDKIAKNSAPDIAATYEDGPRDLTRKSDG